MTMTTPIPSQGSRPKRRRLSPQKLFWNGFHYTILILASLSVVAPLLLAFNSSFKTPLELLRGSRTDLPNSITNLENYMDFFEKQPVGLSFYKHAVCDPVVAHNHYSDWYYGSLCH